MLGQKIWRGLAVFITAFLVSMPEVYAAGPVMGPFRLNFRSLNKCPTPMDGLQMVNFTVNTLKAVPGALSTYFIDGAADLGENYDDSISSIVSLAVIGKNNQLRPIRKMRFNEACSAMLTNFQFTSNLLKAAGVKPQCPLSAGHYAIHNQSVTLESVLIKEFLYAKWRMDVELLNPAGQNWGCVRLFVDTVPR